MPDQPSNPRRPDPPADESTLTASPGPVHTQLTARPGDRFGRYKILEEIGQGGCGAVFVAEQEEPVRRLVALKVIKLGMDTRQVIARFEAERQALAMMNHPNIAKVLDAGATDTGRPFFVMELVRGIKITDYCDQNRLSTSDRLKLFIQVCQAVQHAHQKGIIHRDLKPSNILVTLQDGVPVPKVIDFGIAKATANQKLTDKTVYTAFEQFIGTPAYMSPEQAEMTGLDIDTRSDVYSLGVLLYELLIGETPFSSEELLGVGLDAMRRILREKDPARPSTKLSTMTAADLTAIARHRQSEPPRLIKAVRGDLDWIVMKCLEKERTRRYETANGLVMDIQRHLGNEPVVARPPSKFYEFQKTVRRHKVGFAATGVVVIALMLGFITSTWSLANEKKARHGETAQRKRAEANEKKAQTETVKSKQVAEFLEEMLQGVGPSVALGRDTTMLREILDKTAERLDTLKGQPAVESELRATLGRVYFDLGLYTQAQAAQRRALALRTKLFGREDLSVAESLNNLGLTLHAAGRWAEAETNLLTALAIQRTLLGPTNEEVAGTLEHLGSDLRAAGKRTEAEPLLRQALAMQKSLQGEENLEVASAHSDLGILLSAEGKLAEAETNLSEALATFKKLLPSQHPEIFTTLSDLGQVLRRERNYANAEKRLREALTLQRQVLGLNHRDTQITLSRLTDVLRKEGKGAQAEPLLREAADAGNERAMSELADVCRNAGKLPESLAWYRKAAGMGYVGSIFWVGEMEYLGEGVATNFAEAIKWYRRAAEAGNANAAVRLGEMYEAGQVVSKDATAAVKWYRQAAEAGSKWGQWRLGWMYENGNGVPKDPTEAAKWYRISADAGSPDGSRLLGEMYRRGEGVPKDAGEAVKLYRKAAAEGDRNVQITLGLIYLHGEGVPKDPAEAAKWLLMAAGDGNWEAQFQLARIYKTGEGVAKDDAEAAKWRRKLVESKDSKALNNAAWMLATSPGSQVRDGATAVCLAEAAATNTSRKEPAILDTLAATYAETGRFTNAITVEQEAIGLLTDVTQIEQFKIRLNLYESGVPYREPLPDTNSAAAGNSSTNGTAH